MDKSVEDPIIGGSRTNLPSNNENSPHHEDIQQIIGEARENPGPENERRFPVIQGLVFIAIAEGDFAALDEIFTTINEEEIPAILERAADVGSFLIRNKQVDLLNDLLHWRDADPNQKYKYSSNFYLLEMALLDQYLHYFKIIYEVTSHLKDLVDPFDKDTKRRAFAQAGRIINRFEICVSLITDHVIENLVENKRYNDDPETRQKIDSKIDSRIAEKLSEFDLSIEEI